MKARILLAALAALILSPLAVAQFTTVTGTIVDPNGLPYANGTIAATLTSSASPTLNGLAYTPPTQPVGLDTTGKFTMRLADNTVLLPGGSTWSFTVLCGGGCVPPAGGKGQVRFTLSGVTISGSAQDISAALNAVALALSNAANAGNGWPFNVVTGTSTVGGTGSETPVNNGQVIASGEWLGPGLSNAGVSLTQVNTGGNLVNGGIYYIEYTLVSGVGETQHSKEYALQLAATCTGGVQCSLDIAPPPIPSGYTGWTTYSATSTGAEKQQTASPNCVNLAAGVHCIIQTVGVGASAPTANTSFVQPPNVQASNCPYSVIPHWFLQRNGGNNYPYAGTDYSIGTPLAAPDGTFTICDRFFINDSGVAIQDGQQTSGGPIRNALFSVVARAGRSTATGAGIDFRVWGFRGFDPLAGEATPTFEQFLGVYGEVFVNNNNFLCGPIGTEDCVGGMRVDAEDQRSAGVNNITSIVGVHGNAGTATAAPTIASCGPCVVGVEGGAGQDQVPNQNTSASYAGVVGTVSAFGTSAGGAVGYDFWAPPPLNRFTSGNGAMYIGAFSSANPLDFAIRSDATARSRWLGSVWLGAADSIHADAGTIGVTGSIADSAGSFSTAQLATPAGPTVIPVGVTGATTYSYGICFVDGNGGQVCSTIGTTNTGNATLTGSNFNQIAVDGSVQTTVWTTAIIYRTVSGGTPSSTGKIGQLLGSALDRILQSGTTFFNDTGLAGDGTTYPTGNTTGSLTAAGLINSSTNTAKQAAANFTTSSAALVTWKSYTLPVVANYSLHCEIIYQQATAAAGLLLGVQSASISPTSMMAHARIFSTLTGTSTDATSVITTTTATTVLTGAAPAATGVNYEAQMDLTIENAAASNVLNIMAATANAADQITILRGSYCSVLP